MSTLRRHFATATLGDVAQAAMSAMPQGNAIDAVVTGVFAAAAVSPTVLLGPVQILIGGTGAGLRAIDGRNRQPGLGADRPRGFRPEDRIPDSAYVGIPALPSALALALASCGACTLNRAMGPALELVSREGNGERRKFLKTLAQRGPSYLAEPAVVEEFTVAAGRIAGGIVTREDLEAVRPGIETCVPSRAFALPVARVPWGGRGIEGNEEAPDSSAVQIVAAADDRGMIAIAAYEARAQGVLLEPFGLEAPWTAAPVLRGQARAKPGEARPFAAPIALLAHEGVFDTALGLFGIGEGERLLGRLLSNLGTAEGVEQAIRAPRAPHEGTGAEAAPFASDVGFALGVARTKHSARGLSDPRRA